MQSTQQVKERILNGELDQVLLDLYYDEDILETQKKRYIKAIENFEYLYGVKEIEIYSAPGRTEIGGNHTDHQNGKVLAASINLDAIAVVAKTDNTIVKVTSEGYPDLAIDISVLEPKKEETKLSFEDLFKTTTKVNNDVVEQKIVALRFVLNFANIMQDKEKTSIAEAMAAAIAAVVSRGAGVTLYKYIIISAWAIIDSYIDVEKLLKGESVPLIEFGDVEKINEIQDYDFYLRLLLLMTDKKTKLLRICDMIEINMKEITGENYRLSGVYNTVYAKVITEFDFISRDLLGIKNKFKREDFYEVSY